MKKTLHKIALLFALTKEERVFLAGILAIAFVGIAARYWHLKNEQPEPYRPAGVALSHQDKSE